MDYYNLIFLGGFIALWLILVKYIFPKLGVPT